MKLMIKMVIFNYLLGIRHSRAWNNKLQKKYRLGGVEMEQVWETAQTLGLYLYVVCKEFYVLGLKNIRHHSNFSEVAHSFGIRAAKSL